MGGGRREVRRDVLWEWALLLERAGALHKGVFVNFVICTIQFSTSGTGHLHIDTHGYCTRAFTNRNLRNLHCRWNWGVRWATRWWPLRSQVAASTNSCSRHRPHVARRPPLHRLTFCEMNSENSRFVLCSAFYPLFSSFMFVRLCSLRNVGISWH